ncbi:hypothetical protein BCR44DRAFT_72201 [Catenaria anguillulae PL171]|uniref:SAP domain-containing protein n=1 Tax=Catenaria anguillulae PL171 TaxID=765915 RepID=A0A1Y2HTT4_9FUNG|nr:hypothetical protein BCR44DRAFT_72201 [Catenaria anguillulae PL171]
MSAMHSAQELEALKRSQLQALCKRFGLKANGKNTELIERIIAYEQQGNGHQSNQPDNAGEPSTPTPAPAQHPPAAPQVDHGSEDAEAVTVDEKTADRGGSESSQTVPETQEAEVLLGSTAPVSADIAKVAEEDANAMDVDPKPLEQLESSPKVIRDMPTLNSAPEAAGPQPVNTDQDSISTMDHYERTDMTDVYEALADGAKLEPETKAATVIDALPEVESLERADLSEVYPLASPPSSHVTSTPPRSSISTRTPPASSGLYPTIDVQRSLDTKLTFKWDPPVPVANNEYTPDKDHDNARSEPGSPCVEKVSRKSADLLKQSAMETRMDVDAPADQEQQGAGPKENASGKQPAENSKAIKPAGVGAGASKLRPVSAPGLVPRVATLAKKPDNRPASSPRQTSTTVAAPTRKLPASASKPAATVASRLPSSSAPPLQRPTKRKAADDPETNQLHSDPTDAHVAKRLKALAPSVAATASSSRPASTPGSATKIGVKKSPGKPVFDLQASLKRKLNYVPKKGPLDKPAPSAGASGSSGHAAGSGLGKKPN